MTRCSVFCESSYFIIRANFLARRQTRTEYRLSCSQLNCPNNRIRLYTLIELNKEQWVAGLSLIFFGK